jgi:hypothetical protein
MGVPLSGEPDIGFRLETENRGILKTHRFVVRNTG